VQAGVLTDSPDSIDAEKSISATYLPRSPPSDSHRPPPSIQLSTSTTKNTLDSQIHLYNCHSTNGLENVTVERSIYDSTFTRRNSMPTSHAFSHGDSFYNSRSRFIYFCGTRRRIENCLWWTSEDVKSSVGQIFPYSN
jgi:hypothetical protein